MLSNLESDYVPLNNLDELDYREPPQHTEYLFDEIPYEPTLEELYADVTPAELQGIARNSFYDGFTDQSQAARKIDYQSLQVKPHKTNQDLVCHSLRMVIAHVRKKHAVERHGVQITDKVQNAALNLVESTPRFDPSSDVSLFGFVKPHLDQSITRYERGASADISHGDIIRVPMNQTAYHRINKLRRGLEYKFRRPLELQEVMQFGTFTQEQFKEYEQCLKTYEPFDEQDETLQAALGYEPDFTEDYLRHAPHDGLSTALSLLGEQERYILVARCGLDGHEPKKVEELAQEFSLTHNRIKQIRRTALKKLHAVPRIVNIIEGIE